MNVYLQNIVHTFSPQSLGGPGHFWSLAVEEHFYLFWPLVVFLFSKENLKIVSSGLVIAALLLRTVFVIYGIDVSSFTFCRMDGLALGSLLAILYQEKTKWIKLTAIIKQLFLPLLAVAMLSFLFLSGSAHPVQQAVKYSIFAFFCAGIVVLALDEKSDAIFPSIFKFPVLRKLGTISYGLYVFHPFVFDWLRGHCFDAAYRFSENIYAALLMEAVFLLGVSVIVSIISWNFYEKPFLLLKRKVKYTDRYKEKINQVKLNLNTPVTQRSV